MMSKAEALKLAESKNLDLVLVAPTAIPPVAKIIEFSKFKYQQEKKERGNKKKTKLQEVKELRLSPFIAENDLNVRLDRAKKFLKGGDKVKLTVFFKGRQITKKQFGYDILKQSRDKLSDLAVVEGEPKFRGKNLDILLKPLKSHDKQ